MSRVRFSRLPADVRDLLIREFGGEQIYIPQRDPAAIDARNQRIKQLYQSNLSSAEIAHRIGISARHVRNLR